MTELLCRAPREIRKPSSCCDEKMSSVVWSLTAPRSLVRCVSVLGKRYNGYRVAQQIRFQAAGMLVHRCGWHRGRCSGFRFSFRLVAVTAGAGSCPSFHSSSVEQHFDPRVSKTEPRACYRHISRLFTKNTSNASHSPNAGKRFLVCLGEWTVFFFSRRQQSG